MSNPPAARVIFAVVLSFIIAISCVVALRSMAATTSFKPNAATNLGAAAFRDTLRTAEENAGLNCTVNPQFEECYGLQGAGCNKINLLDTCPDGWQAVSVGSLTHDQCCHECMEGQMCSEQGLADFRGGLLGGTLSSGSTPCAREWRKAWWNLIDGRYWCAQQDRTEVGLVDSNATRSYETATFGGQLHERVSMDTAAPADSLCAPADQALDCVDCTDCRGEHACAEGLGDSEFCCSGRFREVASSLFGNKRWGICA